MVCTSRSRGAEGYEDIDEQMEYLLFRHYNHDG